MKNHLKKIGIILMCMSLIWMVGCGKEKNQEAAMGRYIEQDLKVEGLVEGIDDFLLEGSDGSVQLIVLNEANKLNCYRQREDLSFEFYEPKWLPLYNKKIEEKNYMVEQIAIDEKNQLYIMCQFTPLDRAEHELPQNCLLKITEEGITEIRLKTEGIFPLHSSQIIITDGKCIVANEYEGVVAFDLETGDLVKEYSTAEREMSLLLKENKLYVASNHEKAINIYNISTGQLEKQIPCDQIDDNTIIFEGDEGIYLINESGIWHLLDQGDIWEQLMEGVNVSIGLPSQEIKAAYYKENQFIVCLNAGYSKTSMKAYIYSKNTPSKPEVELSMYMLGENENIREILIAYELQHPEVRINIRQGVSQEGGISKEQAIQALNTELLAGAGPDLLLLDGLNIETYTEKGILMNLEALDGLSQLYPQIEEAMKQGESIYMVPLRFKLPCFFGDEAILNQINSIQDFMTYQNSHMKKLDTLSYPWIGRCLYDHVAKLASKDWITNEGNLNIEKISQFLEGMKKLRSFYPIEDDDIGEMDEEYDFAIRELDVAEAFMINKESNLIKVWNINEDNDMGITSGIAENNPQMTLKPFKQEEKVCFEPISIVGINQNTKEGAIAQDILNFMLQEENQELELEEGLPTQKEALEKFLSGTDCDGWAIQMGAEPNSIHSKSIKLAPVFRDIIKQIEQPIIRDYTLEDIVYEEAKPYLDGQKSLEEVLEKLEEKIAFYS